MFSIFKTKKPDPDHALPGRQEPLLTEGAHFVNGRPIFGPYPEGHELALFGMGCFWGVERLFWTIAGVWVTSVGYAGGSTPNPTYREVCTGRTGHNEVAQVVFDPERVSYQSLLRVFWEGHDPTQGMRQGNDIGTQYRSGIYCYTEAQLRAARNSKDAYARELRQHRLGEITTEIEPATAYYLAEDYHQQYLARNTGGYCGLRGTGIACPTS